MLVPTEEQRSLVLTSLADLGISATFHYSPLHASAAGRRFGKVSGPLKYTDELAPRLIRLPLFADIKPEDQMRVVEALGLVLGKRERPRQRRRLPSRGA